MSKSLKDIVEEGFARLAVLSEKRKELLLRCEEFADGSSSPQCKQGLNKLESTEVSYSQEISAHVDRSQEVLQQTLAQIVEDNERFLASVKENLHLRITRVLKELERSRDWLIAGSTEKYESLIMPLEREMEAGKTELRFQAVKLLGDLEASCKRSQSALNESQAEIAGRLSSSEHELIGMLGSDFGTLVQESEKRRSLVTQSLEMLYKQQSEQMTTLTEEMDQRISLVVAKKLESVKALGNTTETSIEQIRDKVLSAAAAEIAASSQEAFSELEVSYEFSHQDLSEKLQDLRRQTNEMLVQVKQFLDELENSIRSSADSIDTELRSRPPVDPVSTLSLRNPVEETIKQLSREADSVAVDFKRQMNELVKIQSDRLSNLCASAETSLSAATQALNTELKQMTRLHDQTWTEREQELTNRLRKLEKEASETYALVGDVGSEDSADGSV